MDLFDALEVAEVSIRYRILKVEEAIALKPKADVAEVSIRYRILKGWADRNHTKRRDPMWQRSRSVTGF